MSMAFWNLTARKADIACFCLVWRHGPPLRVQISIGMSLMVITSEELLSFNLQVQYTTIVRANTSTLIRCEQRTYRASHALLDLLCHVSQDNIVIIVSGSEIARDIQIFSETIQASG